MCSKLRDKTVSKDSRLTSSPKSRFEQWTNITVYVGKRKTKILSVNCRRSHLILTGSTQDKPRSKHKRQRSYKITKTEATSFPLYRQVAKLSMATSMRTCVPTAAQFIVEKIDLEKNGLDAQSFKNTLVILWALSLFCLLAVMQCSTPKEQVSLSKLLLQWSHDFVLRHLKHVVPRI